MQPLLAGFKQINTTYNQAAIALGISPFKRFMYLTLPLLKPSIGSAFALGFAHTLGEFGLVLMIGGNIQGETHNAKHRRKSISSGDIIPKIIWEAQRMCNINSCSVVQAVAPCVGFCGVPLATRNFRNFSSKTRILPEIS